MSSTNCEQKISVIIPTWNRANTIKCAILSALNQSYHPFEILVCDDGSTDNTEAIVRSIPDSRIRWISGGHSGCPAVPRNRGIFASRGDLVAFLDSDDYWLPEKLEAQLVLMRNTGLQAVCTNAYREVDGTITGLLISDVKKVLCFPDLLKDNKVVCSSILINRSILLQAEGFPEHEELRVGEDYCLWLRVSRLTPIAFTDKALVVYKDAPAISVRSHGPSADIQRQRAVRGFLAWRKKRSPLNALVDASVIWAITISTKFQTDSRQCFHKLYQMMNRWR